MLAYPFSMVLHTKLKKKEKDIPVYVGRELILRLDLNLRPSERQQRGVGRHLNLPPMLNSSHVSTGIKSLCSKIAVGKKQ